MFEILGDVEDVWVLLIFEVELERDLDEMLKK